MHVFMNELATIKEQIIMSKRSDPVPDPNPNPSRTRAEKGPGPNVSITLNLLYCMYLVVP